MITFPLKFSTYIIQTPKRIILLHDIVLHCDIDMTFNGVALYKKT